jgi:hypothetical protein
MRLWLGLLVLLVASASCRGGRGKSNPSIRNDASAPSSAVPPLSAPNEAKALALGGHWQVVRQGKQPGPQLPNQLRAHVTVWDTSGKRVFTSRPSNEGVNVDLESLSLALREVVRLIGIGGLARLWLPPQAMEGWKPHSFPAGDLIYDLEVLEEVPAPTTTIAPVAPIASGLSTSAAPPPDLSGPPKDSQRTRGGLSYVIQSPGTGAAVPSAASAHLRINAWAQRGLTAEQVVRDQSISLTPAGAPAGLGGVLTQLAPSGQARIWVPANKAKDLFPRQKDEALIVDITLVSVDDH